MAEVAAHVTLHIYDVSTDHFVSMVNQYMKPIGTGAFHGGVEVYGKEWSYGYCEQDTGVFACHPKGCSAHHYRESIAMGVTAMSKEEVEALLRVLMGEWPGESYDLLRHNCCSFCDELCRRLGVGSIPVWVTNLAAAGATLQDGVFTAVSAGRSAAIIAAAKAGEFDARYNLQGIAQAKARVFVETLSHLDKTYQIHETARQTAVGLAAQTAEGTVRAASEIFAGAAEARQVGSGSLHDGSASPTMLLLEDPFLKGVGLVKPLGDPVSPTHWRGGAAAATSDVNRAFGRWVGTLWLHHDQQQHEDQDRKWRCW